MITVKGVVKLQSDYKVADDTYIQSEVSYGEYVDNCRIYIRGNINKEYHNSDWDAQRKTQHLESLIADFVKKHPSKVEGYVSPEGIVNSDLLLSDVIDSVTGIAVIKYALEEDETVDEIQINDKDTIIVSRGGRYEPYVDREGRVMRFSSNEEIHTLINKLIDDGTGNIPQFTDGNPILNAKTAKHQYRISAVHHSANTQDKPPYNYPITTVTIRKFKEVKLTIEDLIKYGACTEEMGHLLKLLGRAEVRLFCVGPTGSGKTTLTQIMANEIPRDKRIGLVQNPSEITFQERDEYGRNKRNVFHWEVTEHAGLDELASNTLRFTPDVALIGESRENTEFAQVLRILRSGHKTLGTFHSEGARDAVGRFATEISSIGGTSYDEAVRLVADVIDVIIAQYKYPDGKRRIVGISEIQGVDDKGKVVVNDVFTFEESGESTINEHGLPEVHGEFKKKGTLSPYLQKKLFRAGVNRSDIEQFLTLEEEK